MTQVNAGRMTEAQALAILDGTKDGREVEANVSLSNGIVRSSKELIKYGHDQFQVYHDIDGSVIAHDRESAAEVLMGVRSPWDGPPELNTDEDGE